MKKKDESNWYVATRFLSANVCPTLPKPVVDIWQSNAVLEDPGISFRSCLTSASKPKCLLAKVLSISTVTEVTQARFDQTIQLAISGSENFQENQALELELQFTGNIFNSINEDSQAVRSMKQKYIHRYQIAFCFVFNSGSCLWRQPHA